jgi:hypothetical protein
MVPSTKKLEIGLNSHWVLVVAPTSRLSKFLLHVEPADHDAKDTRPCLSRTFLEMTSTLSELLSDLNHAVLRERMELLVISWVQCPLLEDTQYCICER